MGPFIDLPPPGRPRADLLIKETEAALQRGAADGEKISTVLMPRSNAEVDKGWVDLDLTSSDRYNKYLKFTATDRLGRQTWESVPYVITVSTTRGKTTFQSNRKSFWESIRGDVGGNEIWAMVETREMADKNEEDEDPTSEDEEQSESELRDGGFDRRQRTRKRSRSQRRDAA